MKLTITYITARHEPLLAWMLWSLKNQLRDDDEITVIVVNRYIKDNFINVQQWRKQITLKFTRPKPTVWQGPERTTKEDWWANSNARNTGICLCQTDWIAFLDDRCVLLDGWLNSIRQAMRHNYAVFGTYEKRVNMVVEDGIITGSGKTTGRDCRLEVVSKHRGNQDVVECPGDWSFGCSLALPLEWALIVNGYDEICDGISMEDVVLGIMMKNCGMDLRFDRRMAMVEDRTPELLGPGMTRKDKGKSPNDKSHALLNRIKLLKKASHPINLRDIRSRMLGGGSWPAPWGPVVDWYDNQPISEM